LSIQREYKIINAPTSATKKLSSFKVHWRKPWQVMAVTQNGQENLLENSPPHIHWILVLLRCVIPGFWDFLHKEDHNSTSGTYTYKGFFFFFKFSLHKTQISKEQRSSSKFQILHELILFGQES
jgi:hypothetical protein